MDIKAEIKIKEILERYPETVSVFSTNGFSANTAEELIGEVGEFLMLKTALLVKGINYELFIKQLEERILEVRAGLQQEDGVINSDCCLISEPEVHKKLNFIGYTYCPMKITLKEGFEDVVKSYQAATGDKDIKYYVPSGCNSGDPYEDLWRAESIEQLPEIIASVGFGDFFRREFVDRFLDKGYFKAVYPTKLHREFIDAGIVDPKGYYTVYSLFPLVMLIDKKKLGKLPMPKRWSDLLNPVYTNNIIIGASHGDFHEEIFLYTYKEHGEEGVIKLTNNIKTGWHASQMAKTAGTNSSEGAAIYVIPWMFAKSCPKTDVTEVVWPVDGALITPTYLLAKESALDKFKLFIDFLTGEDYGKKSADNYFPVANCNIDNKLPEGAAFKWIGWDYIRSRSIHDQMEYVMDIFKQAWAKRYEKGERIL